VNLGLACGSRTKVVQARIPSRCLRSPAEEWDRTLALVEGLGLVVVNRGSEGVAHGNRGAGHADEATAPGQLDIREPHALKPTW